jgi:hypothetical protein
VTRETTAVRAARRALRRIRRAAAARPGPRGRIESGIKAEDVAGQRRREVLDRARARDGER